MSHDSRNYYDEQFGARINQIAKPGATPPPASGPGSSRGWGFKGAGGLVGVVVFIVIRVLLFAGRSNTSYSPPTYQYTPPPTYQVPPPRFDFPPPNKAPEKQWDDKKAQDKDVQQFLDERNAKDKQ